jgi:hypothetical protein
MDIPEYGIRTVEYDLKIRRPFHKLIKNAMG